MSECYVSVNGHRIEGDEEYCRGVFLVACTAAKKSQTFAVSRDELVLLTPVARVELHVAAGFESEFDHVAAFERLASASAASWKML